MQEFCLICQLIGAICRQVQTKTFVRIHSVKDYVMPHQPLENPVHLSSFTPINQFHTQADLADIRLNHHIKIFGQSQAIKMSRKTEKYHIK